MGKFLKSLVLVMTTSLFYGQQNNLPEDFRQHNLTQFNSNLFNPTFSFDRNLPSSLSIWSRWQWQSIDADPTSLFVNYTQKLSAQSAGGLGFFQNNTGVYLNTGGILNYAFAIPLGEESNLIFGANVFAYQQEWADNQVNPPTPLEENNFIAQFAPGLRIQVKDFGMAMTIENALDYNFTNNERQGAERVLAASISNRFPIFLFNEVSFIRPLAYVRAVPNADAQYGLTALFSNPNFWIQGGYNSYYGAAGGAGITFFKRLSLGAVVEFGIEDAIKDEDPTFEIIASYHFGKQTFAKKEKKEKKSEEEKLQEAAEKRKLAEEISRAEEEEKERQRLEEARLLEQAKQDSIASVRAAALASVKEENRLDSIAKAQRNQEVTLQPNEKYEEVVSADGLEPGFYLIANVFGTKKYFENFMKTLQTKGLEPKSFFRSLNGYNYVYLKRYNTIQEARAARNSGFNGKYKDALWIFRVRGD